MTDYNFLYDMAREDIQEAQANWDSMYNDESGCALAEVFDNVNTASGVSKIAFLDKKYGDFVIKLPIRGEVSYGRCKLESPCNKSVCDCCDCEEYDEDYENNDNNPIQNYCEKEVLIYNRAKKYKIDFLFAAEEFLGNINEIPVYAQERVAEVENESGRTASRESVDTVKNKFGYTNLPMNFAANVLQYYNKTILKKLLRFIKKNHLNDFHSGNCGYFADGRPVLFDYSGV